MEGTIVNNAPERRILPPLRLLRPRPGVWLAWLPAALVLLPLAVVLWRAAGPVDDAVWRQILEHRLPGYLRHSAGLAVYVTLLALAFGVPAAWVISMYDFPGRKILEWAMLLPLAMPAYVAALAYLDALQALTPVYVWIRKHYGVEAFRSSQQFGPWFFSVLVLGSTLYPYVFLSCRAAFARQAAGAIEAARMLGAGRWRIFRTVALPMARPAVAAGGLLVALEALNDYGVVTAFGLNPLTPGIFRVWGEGHPDVAMRLAVILLLTALCGAALERLARRRRRYVAETTGVPLSRKRLRIPGVLAAWLACGLPLALGFLIPGARLLRWAILSRDILDWPTYLRAAEKSFTVAGLATLCIMTGAILLVFGQRALRAPSLNLARRLAATGYASPSALIAVGAGFLISQVATSQLPGAARLALSVSLTGLVVACFTRYLAAGMQPVEAGFERVPSGLHEASRTLGGGPLRTLWRVDLPLALPAIVAGAALAFIDVFKELTLTLILRPFNFETLSTLVFRMADEARVPEASVPALFLVGCSLLGMIPMTLLLRRVTS